MHTFGFWLLLPFFALISKAALLRDPRPFITENPLRVYVYDHRSHPALAELVKIRSSKKYASKCASSMWGSEFALHDRLIASPLRTRDPEKADFFYVPVFSKCDSIAFRSKLTERLVLEFLSSSPYFARWGGRDHVALFPSGSGPHFLSNWTRYLGESIFLMAESHFSSRGAQRAPYFNPHKDVVVPGYITRDRLDTLMAAGAASPQKARKRLACFVGSLQGLPSRRDVHSLSQSFPAHVFSFTKKFGSFSEYASTLAECRFCLVPRGQSAWTLRLFESLFLECIPVVINNFVQLPFEHLINYTTFSVKWPASRVDASLVDHLRRITETDRERAVENMRKVRCLLQWHEGNGSTPLRSSTLAPTFKGTLPPLSLDPSCSAMLGIYDDLAHRPRGLKHSPTSFWGLGGKMVDRNGTELVTAADKARGSAESGRFEVLDIYGRKPAICKGCDRLPVMCRQVGNRMVCRGRGKLEKAEEQQQEDEEGAEA